jgi:hypothetical protein
VVALLAFVPTGTMDSTLSCSTMVRDSDEGVDAEMPKSVTVCAQTAAM